MCCSLMVQTKRASFGGIDLHDLHGKLIFKKGSKVDAQNNNEAEYSALEIGLNLTLKHGVRRL